MLFQEKKSALVRLSDGIKYGLTIAAEMSEDILELYALYENPYKEARNIARLIIENKIDPTEGELKIKTILSVIPEEQSHKGVYLQAGLHSHCLSIILLCCYCLESYINSLAYHLFKEIDYLGLFRQGKDISAEILLDAIEKMTTKTKWETLAKLGTSSGFDKSKPPFQDFNYLFNFRNDNVHDKVIDYSEDRAKKRYNKKFPDPVSGLLNLRHVLYAAEIYWGMVEEIHRLIGIDMANFHKHYNLRPWYTEQHYEELSKLSRRYYAVFPSDDFAG